MAVSYKALLTVSELKAYAFATDSSILDTSVTTYDGALEDIIENTSRLIDKHYGQQLIVKQYVDSREDLHWLRDDRADNSGSDTTIYALANHSPIVEVDSAATESGQSVTTPSIRANSNGLYFSTTYDNATKPLLSITYFAGYRRADQTVDSLDNETDLANLATLPDELPWEFRQACVDIAMFQVNRMSRSAIGNRGSRLAIAGGTSGERIFDQDYVQKRLRDLPRRVVRW